MNRVSAAKIHNGMNMVGHDDETRDFGIRIMFFHVLELLHGKFPDGRQFHDIAILADGDFPKITFAVCRANRHMIETAIVIMPHGTRRRNAIDVVETVGHCG